MQGGALRSSVARRRARETRQAGGLRYDACKLSGRTGGLRQ
jgi:hypothetical protein